MDLTLETHKKIYSKKNNRPKKTGYEKTLNNRSTDNGSSKHRIFL